MGGAGHEVEWVTSVRRRVTATVSRWQRRAREHAARGEFGVLFEQFGHGLRELARDTTPLADLLFSRGLYLHRTRRGAVPTYRLHRFSLPAGCERIGTARFTVDLDKVITYCGFSYLPGGWSPALALLHQYQDDPSLRYEDSVLCELYERFQPATVHEALFDEESDPLTPFDRMPSAHSTMRFLWGLERRQVQRLVAGHPHEVPLDDHSRFYGPKSDAAGARHFERFISTYESIREHGYRPDDFGGGTAQGYFLVRGDDYRFVANRLNHRLPAMRLLGVHTLVARPLVGHPPVIEEAHLERFSTGNGGAYPLEVVRALFDQMFTSTGAQKAQALGLRSPDRPHEGIARPRAA